MGKKPERICFLGKGGIGKSVLASNMSEALTLEGFHVLQIGTDISLSSTLLLRGFIDIPSVLEDYRDKYDIQLNDYIVKSDSGVYCMELGSIEPGVGCLARGISQVDEMLTRQNVFETYEIDYVLYDITGDTPCTGFILPMREGIMQRTVVISSGSFPSLSTANSILAGITRKGTKHQNASLLVNFADEFQAKSLLSDYAEHVNIPILSYVDTFSTIKSSYLEDKTVFRTSPDSTAAETLKNIAKKLINIEAKEQITPLEQRELLYWQQNWKKKELDHHSGYSTVDSYSI